MGKHVIPAGTEPLAERITSAKDLYRAAKNSGFIGAYENAIYRMDVFSADCERLTYGVATENFWMVRELMRRDLGVYPPVKIFGEEDNLCNWLPYNNFFIHEDPDDNTLIRYTLNEEQGIADRQVSTRLGRFLQAHFADIISAENIKNLATQHRVKGVPFTLHWANDALEIERVYMECATGSCMSKTRDFWNLETDGGETVHPTHVYDSPDIGLAYVKDLSGRVVARALINKLTNKFVRIYGHIEAMLHLLREHGITEQGNLHGTRLRRIPLANNRVAVPYLDGGVTTFNIEPDWLRISKQGSHNHPNYSVAAIDLPMTCRECGHQGRWHHSPSMGAPADVCSSCILPHLVQVVTEFERVHYHWQPHTQAAYAPSTNTEELVEVRNSSDAVIYCDPNLTHFDEATVQDHEGTYYFRSAVSFIVAPDGTVSITPTRTAMAEHNLRHWGDALLEYRGAWMIRSVFYHRDQLDQVMADREELRIYDTTVHRSLVVNAIYRRDGATTRVDRRECHFEAVSGRWFTNNLITNNYLRWDDRGHYYGVDNEGKPARCCNRLRDPSQRLGDGVIFRLATEQELVIEEAF